jgi:hypothetical protein
MAKFFFRNQKLADSSKWSTFSGNSRRFCTRNIMEDETSPEPEFEVNRVLASESLEVQIEKIKSKKGFIVDMDGVLYHQNHGLPGITDFLKWLRDQQKKYIFLTNASEVGRGELSKKLERLTGLKVLPFLSLSLISDIQGTFLHQCYCHCYLFA